MENKRIAVIMAGGAGERFWPVSRLSRPKQLLKLGRPDMSLLDEAVERAAPIVGKENLYIATGKTVETPIRESKAVTNENIWVEPMKRNTLGALCWVAANLLAKEGKQVSMAVLTADHRITPSKDFQKCVRLALDTAEKEGALVTIGIRPDRPETGFGYIELVEKPEDLKGIFRAKSFREKPDQATAEEFVSEGRFLWNSGMFFWTLESFLRELEMAQPQAHELTVKMAQALEMDAIEQAERHFESLPDISIDFALMEKAEKVMVVASTFDWDDVGAWDALERTFEGDDARNVAFGDASLIDSEGCVIYNDSNEILVSVLNVKDLLVVVTKDAVMVCPKSDAQRVREIVQKLKEHRPELT